MGFSSKQRELIHERAQDSCERCGRFGATDIHHRLFRSRGGKDEVGNGILLCGWGNTKGCHGFAHSGKDAEQEGFSIRTIKGVKPALVPVKMAAPGGLFRWFLLDDRGNKTYLPTDDAIERLVEMGIRPEVTS